ncbi:Interleukin-17 receptor A [Liparis tanakae]|uniref:Interleukin-17 receptor A n=1 Tax=Liparis tanakae TaxID=230148 RepID=A0A4Z2I372_9TELE|nr:Interleukin-17 receptor A [Liparis tanakae]
MVSSSLRILDKRLDCNQQWTFSLDGVVVEPDHIYRVSVFNLPEPDIGDYKINKTITIPGSLWDPDVTTAVSLDKELGKFSIVVSFKTAQYSERYRVSIQSSGFRCSKDVSKIQPFFVRCKNDCGRPEKIIDVCQDPVNTSSAAAKQQPEGFKVQDRKRVLIIYSLDHPLYKSIVLSLCAFLASKCGTEVVLDLLDSRRLGLLGSIQWLDWHREQIESSSDKILILCSRGVKAKWRAMCGDERVILREDACSPAGDMLSPALSLMVPHFVRSASFEKYIVAYFDNVCCEEDVPSPFLITVRYKLMKQFEELFFRILDTERHEPGRVNHIEGLSEDEYHRCPSGRALRDAIEAFHAYQLERPQWFENELLRSSETSVEIHDDVKTTKNLSTHSVPDWSHVSSHVETRDVDFTGDGTGLNVA